MVSDAQRLANKKYYEKVRATRMEEMREKARIRAAEHKEYLRTHPEAVEAEREKSREKYHKWLGQNKRKIIKEWLSDEGLCETFKRFLRECVIPVVDDAPKKLLDMCWEHLAIAVNRQGITPAQEVDARGEKEED